MSKKKTLENTDLEQKGSVIVSLPQNVHMRLRLLRAANLIPQDFVSELVAKSINSLFEKNKASIMEVFELKQE